MLVVPEYLTFHLLPCPLSLRLTRISASRSVLRSTAFALPRPAEVGVTNYDREFVGREERLLGTGWLTPDPNPHLVGGLSHGDNYHTCPKSVSRRTRDIHVLM